MAGGPGGDRPPGQGRLPVDLRHPVAGFHRPQWAVETATRKKKQDFSPAEFLTLEEGLCVQMMHHGPFDTEAASLARMDAFIQEQGYENDLGGGRLHHEIYLSDARKVPPERWRTVLRHPVRLA